MTLLGKVVTVLRRPNVIAEWWRAKRIETLHRKHADIVNAGERILGLEADTNAMAHKRRYEFAATLLRQATSILDFACGTGYGSYIIAERNRRCHVFGYDRDRGAIAFGQRHFRVRNLRLTTTEPTGKFDMVCAFEYLEHTDDIQRSFDDLLRRSQQLLVVSVPFEETPGNNPHHRHFHLNEQSLHSPATPRFYYQHPNGSIDASRLSVQNLIIVVERLHG